jgi:hypothetical protein
MTGQANSEPSVSRRERALAGELGPEEQNKAILPSVDALDDAPEQIGCRYPACQAEDQCIYEGCEAVAGDGQHYIWRIVWRSVNGTLTYGPEVAEANHAQAYLDDAKESVPNPSQTEVWVERRLVTAWERCSS